MTDPEPGPLPLAAGLDAASRRAAARFALTLASIAAFAVLPALCGLFGPATALAALARYCTIAAILKLVAAILRKAPPGAPSLNEWDEGMALIGASCLSAAGAHLLA